MSKSVYYYKPLPKEDTVIEQALQQKQKNDPKKVFGRRMNVYVMKVILGIINGCIEFM